MNELYSIEIEKKSTFLLEWTYFKTRMRKETFIKDEEKNENKRMNELKEEKEEKNVYKNKRNLFFKRRKKE